MEHLEVNINGEQKELLIRTGAALPLREPKILDVSGQINSISQYIAGREIDTSKAVVLVDRDNLFIRFIDDQENHYQTTITGKLVMNPDLGVFSINSGEQFNPSQLAQVIRMNRALFPDRQEAMALHTKLRNFKAKINQEVEKMNDDSGDYKILFEQKVETESPKEFELEMPIFKGCDKVKLKIEFVFTARNNDVTIDLISPEMQEYIMDTTDSLIDQEKKSILDHYSGMVIIEL